MAKKYIVDLNEDEVSQLQSIIKKGKHKARSITRANILGSIPLFEVAQTDNNPLR
ncbi:hypothetical protein IQ274_30985 [Nostoc sp. LEGE 12447]|uniref:hypothetical protein n=1 Tax=Nostoc sp. LEGE 12447 TaxID=1828640 RepID=UPI00188319DE|nr:hypothetical protein [Nostoc sp. LEGE 12447]MBE9002495.1 hypothetical protein [Nostoc sp. LEGE 12447]